MEKPPVCFTCNKELGTAHLAYESLLQLGETAKSAMDSLEIRKTCCRTMLLTALDLFDDPAQRVYVPASVRLAVANGNVVSDDTPEAIRNVGVAKRKEPICIRPL